MLPAKVQTFILISKFWRIFLQVLYTQVPVPPTSAGFTDEEISPLFEKAHDAENIVLPPGW